MRGWATIAVFGSSSAWEAVREDFSDLPDLRSTLRILVRLLIAVILGGLLGFQRQLEGKPAGLRTHMLVSLGTALFVLIPWMAGMGDTGVSRAIQGALAGIGFIGGGTILKLQKEHIVEGVTTAASIWVVAGIGIAAGLGRLWSAILSAVIALVVLAVLGRLEDWLTPKPRHNGGEPPESTGSLSG